jgi:hypothetical protein
MMDLPTVGAGQMTRNMRTGSGLPRDVAEQGLDRCQRFVVVGEHSSAQLGDGEFVRQYVVEAIFRDGFISVEQRYCSLPAMRGPRLLVWL